MRNIIAGVALAALSCPAVAAVPAFLNVSNKGFTDRRCTMTYDGQTLNASKCRFTSDSRQIDVFADNNGCTVSITKATGKVTLWAYRDQCGPVDATADYEIKLGVLSVDKNCVVARKLRLCVAGRF